MLSNNLFMEVVVQPRSNYGTILDRNIQALNTHPIAKPRWRLSCLVVLIFCSSSPNNQACLFSGSQAPDLSRQRQRPPFHFCQTAPAGRRGPSQPGSVSRFDQKGHRRSWAELRAGLELGPTGGRSRSPRGSWPESGPQEATGSKLPAGIEQSFFRVGLISFRKSEPNELELRTWTSFDQCHKK